MSELYETHFASDGVIARMAELQSTIKQQAAKIAELRDALTLCLGAIIEMTPCVADDCQQSQTEWKTEAEELARKALSSTDSSNWLQEQKAQWRREFYALLDSLPTVCRDSKFMEEEYTRNMAESTKAETDSLQNPAGKY